MTNPISHDLARLPLFEGLLRDAYEKGEVSLQIHRGGIFNEEQFLVSGRLSILERHGLVSVSRITSGARPGWTEERMWYELTPPGRRLVETTIVAQAGAAVRALEAWRPEL